jgi:hypothetical protein
MISHSAVNTGDFIYCSVYQGPHETTVYFNDYDKSYHQAIYLIEGNIDTYPSTTVDLASDAVNAPLVKGILYDISHTKGMYVIGKTQTDGASMVMFNPVPCTETLNIEMVSGAQTREVTAGAKKVTIVCLTGPVAINNNTVDSMQFAKVFPGKTATITLTEGSICALVS